MKKKNIGSSFDSWLREEGVYEEVTATAIKRVLARQVEAAMKEKNFSKAEMARRMYTSRAALDRLLDPEYDAVTLNTLRKAAAAVGRELRLELRRELDHAFALRSSAIWNAWRLLPRTPKATQPSTHT